MLIKAVVFMHFEVGDQTQGSLWKFHEFPCLPPIGSILSFQTNNGEIPDHLQVEEIQWWDKHPEYFEIHLETVVIDETLDDFLNETSKLGWKNMDDADWWNFDEQEQKQ